MITDRTRSEAPLLWVALLTAASVATTLVFACATPFPSLAALAAVHMRRQDGVLLTFAAWIASQALGFACLGYPWNASTAIAGVAIGTAAVAATLAASVADARLPVAGTAGRLAIAYLTAFVVFKAGIAAWSPLMSHAGAALSPDVIARQFVRYAAILAGLYALYRVLVAAGVPAARTSDLRRRATA